MDVRKPTTQEKQALVAYLEAHGHRDMSSDVDRWAIAVFLRCPLPYVDYRGKLLVVAYTTSHPVGLDSAQMFMFSHGALTPVESPLRALDWLTPQVYKGGEEHEAEEYS